MWCSETEVFKIIDFGVSFSISENMRHAIQSKGNNQKIKIQTKFSFFYLTAYQSPECNIWNRWINSSRFGEMPDMP